MSEIKFETAEQKASYGIGLQMGQQLAGSGLEGLSVDAIAAGIATALTGEMHQSKLTKSTMHCKSYTLAQKQLVKKQLKQQQLMVKRS